MPAYLANVYNDFQGLAALKGQARKDQAGALNKVANQFDALFVSMMLKQMRQASFGGGILDSNRTDQYRDMYDQQLALHLSQKGGLGIGDVIKRQLNKEQTAAGSEITLSGLDRYRERPVMPCVRSAEMLLEEEPTTESSPPQAESTTPAASNFSNSNEFVKSLWPAAERAASAIGLPPEALLAQAALETGWGAHVIERGDGGSSHNLFGIKADSRWDGQQVRRETLEFEADTPVRKREAFRAYTSFEQSFQDYVSLLQSSPRYTDALAQTQDCAAYFQSLQESGYATDPDYAAKILRVMHSDRMQAAVQQVKADNAEFGTTLFGG